MSTTPDALKKDTRVFRHPQTISPTKKVLDAFGGGNDATNASLAATTLGSGAASFEEEAPAYNPTYPLNTVLLESESGHLIEVDDTPNAERVHIYHRSGSHIEMRPDGGVKHKTVKKRQDITVGDHEISITGDCDIIVDGGYSLHIRKGELIIDVKDDAAINVKGKLKISANTIDMTAVDKISLNAPNVDIGAIGPGGRPMISLPTGITVNEKFPADPTFVPKVNFPLTAAGKLNLTQALKKPNPSLDEAGALLSSAQSALNSADTIAKVVNASSTIVSASNKLKNAVANPPMPTDKEVAVAIAKTLRDDAVDPSGEPAFSRLTEQPGELPLSSPRLYTSAQVLAAGQVVGALSSPLVYQQLRARAFDTPDDVQNLESYNAHINLSIELGDFTKDQKTSTGIVLQSDTTAPAPEPIPPYAFPLPSGGTVVCTANSREIQGTNTKLNEDLAVGETVELNGVRGVIESIASDTSAVLREPWSGTTSSGALQVYRLRPMQEFFGKFTYADTEVLGHSGLQLGQLVTNFISPVIEVPQINASMLVIQTGAVQAASVTDTTNGTSETIDCGTPDTSIPSLDVRQFYNPQTMDLSTVAGCGKFVEAVIAGTGPEWGHIQKTSGQANYQGHAVDAILYKSPVPLYNGLFYQAVDIIQNAVARNAQPQWLPVCAPDNGTRFGGKNSVQASPNTQTPNNGPLI